MICTKQLIRTASSCMTARRATVGAQPKIAADSTRGMRKDLATKALLPKMSSILVKTTVLIRLNTLLAVFIPKPSTFTVKMLMAFSG